MRTTLFCLVASILMIQYVQAGTNQSKKINPKNTTIKDVLVLHPMYSVYHVSDTVTRVFFSISSKELLYMKPSKTSDMMVARGKIKFTLLPSYNSTLVIDSSSVYFVDTLSPGADQTMKISGSFDVALSYSKVVVAELEFQDINRGNDALTILLLNKKTRQTRQNFLVVGKSDKLPLTQNFITSNDSVILTYNKDSVQKKLFVKYYLGEYLLPPPPFSYQERKPFNFTPDSVFVVELDANYQVSMNFTKRGIYHFVTDTASLEGYTMIRYTHSVPEFDDAQEMLKSIRFITTKQEHDELMSSDNLKLALDKYWLRCAQNNKDKARTLIKNYYTRIEKANTYFSSFDEGWKTDRGLVFLIFGSPQSVTRDNFSETWIYGDEKNTMRQVRFVYTKVENPFTDNDYILNRSESYKEIWFRNVDAWRMGRVLNEN